MNRYYKAVFLWISMFSSLAMAGSNWNLVPQNSVDKEQLSQLQNAYPKIENNSQLNSLLKDLSKIGNFKSLQASKEQQQIKILAKNAYRISKISVKTISRAYKRKIDTLLYIYRDQVDS